MCRERIDVCLGQGWDKWMPIYIEGGLFNVFIITVFIINYHFPRKPPLGQGRSPSSLLVRGASVCPMIPYDTRVALSFNQVLTMAGMMMSGATVGSDAAAEVNRWDLIRRGDP